MTAARETATDDARALAVHGLQLARGATFALRVERLEVGSGGCVSIEGPSGSGKSSLLDAIVGLARVGDPLRWSGVVEFAGRLRPQPGSDAHRRLLAEHVAVVPQDARAALDPLAPIGDQLAWHVRGLRPGDVDAAFAQLGLASGAELLARRPHELSGGQAQRVLLALALLRRPALCFCDEPTAGLDAPRSRALGDAIARLRAASERTAFVVFGHDHAFAERLGATRYRVHEGTLRRDDSPPLAWQRAERGEPGEVLLAAEGLTLRHGARTVVSGFDLALRGGEIVALLGPSGAGKTTLARALAGHLEPAAGRVTRAVPRTQVQLLFQDAAGSLTPSRSVGALCRETSAVGFRLDDEAKRLGLDPALLVRGVEALSGGERRRAALLRALGVLPRVLLLDEPTSNLDRDRARDVVELLLELRRRSRVAMLWITHDDGLAAAVADRVVRIEEAP